MGYIKQEVQDNYKLKQKDLSIAKLFTCGFNINYGDIINIENTTITAFILEPEDFIKDGFGLEKEILLIISHFKEMEARTIRAAENLFGESPFRNRVDNLCYF